MWTTEKQKSLSFSQNAKEHECRNPTSDLFTASHKCHGEFTGVHWPRFVSLGRWEMTWKVESLRKASLKLSVEENVMEMLILRNKTMTSTHGEWKSSDWSRDLCFHNLAVNSPPSKLIFKRQSHKTTRTSWVRTTSRSTVETSHVQL